MGTTIQSQRRVSKKKGLNLPYPAFYRAMVETAQQLRSLQIGSVLWTVMGQASEGPTCCYMTPHPTREVSMRSLYAAHHWVFQAPP